MNRLERLEALDRTHDEPVAGDARRWAWHGGAFLAARAASALSARSVGRRIAVTVQTIASLRRRLPSAAVAGDRHLAASVEALQLMRKKAVAIASARNGPHASA